jgi:hypothetical protein
VRGKVLGKRTITVELKVVEAGLSDVFSDIARFHLDHRPFARAGKIVVLKAGTKTARVVARGANGNSKDTISLDSATRERLVVKANQKATFDIQKASFADEVIWAWTATDAMPRIAARLSAVSVCLGLIGLILGIISLCR